MLDSNYDINVWDKAGYLSDYKKEGWVLTPYTINHEWRGVRLGQQRCWSTK